MKQIDKQLFTLHHHALEQACPECGQPLQMRHGKHGAFLGCSAYPSCDYIKPLHQASGQVVKALGVACPECGSELVLRQGRYGMFIGCSHYPECHHIESPDHHDEPEKSIACPECRKGHLVERKSRYGKVFYACDGYPKCKFAVNHPPAEGVCEHCGYPLLIEKPQADAPVLFCACRKCGARQG